ncbi:MAG TPA: ribonuclease P protein component [Dictyoglomaceae bacterium]|nr:ribonuclease P protein component [Dictyoglomaceae bacterium]HOL39991.1 ribonuclease P protein component [Dictyoglomaceae bacterium]HOP95217.1 ribonuclease P protein component [Dictyoglomaceae bacterium]HPP16581.1 ribonuclease P protein component [Dictyoglomaceae bacterium]HPU43749.1 ribonuclease P protein component [Dictyoglomaceae bacterium]
MGSFSFPKEERLKKQEDFLKILREGKPYFLSKNFVVYIRKAEKRKIGISINKKVGTAVVRNRIKRLIREVYRLHRPYLRDDIEMLIIVKPGEEIKDIDFHKMKNMLIKIWEKAGVFKND